MTETKPSYFQDTSVRKPDPALPDNQMHPEASLRERIARAVHLARLSQAWEDLWPRLIWPLGVILAFVAVSWLGLWLYLPDVARWIGLGGFGLALLASLFAFRGIDWPSHAAGLQRVEALSGYRHRPLQAIEDQLPDGADAVTLALWTEHRRRIMASVAAIRSGLPQPGLGRKDRYGLRVVLAMLLFVGYFAAGDSRRDRLFSAFRTSVGEVLPESRLDAWVTPPAYTGKPALLLTAQGGVTTEPDGTIRVPQGSLLNIRASAPVRRDAAPVSVASIVAGKATPIAQKPLEAAATPAAAPAPATLPIPAANRAAVATEYEVTLGVAAEVKVVRGSETLASWKFSVEPDAPPTIKFIGKPEAQISGTLKLGYELADDYGVIGAEARFSAAPDTFSITTNAQTVRPLVEAPDFPLSLPQGRPKSGAATTFKDLTAHPWAGAKLKLTLIARDEAGQEGRSETIDVVLPEKIFTKPLARALIEQRRILALDANRLPQVRNGFDALLIAPEHFYPESAVFLGVTKIYRDLGKARSDEDLQKVLDFVWQVAIAIEDGTLTQAEKALRDAEEALRKALEQGASDKEIAKLTDDLRKALDRFMRELAEAQRNNPQARQPNDPNQRVLRQQDLNKMLDRIENLAKTGSRDAARQMLSEMQRMLENLRAGRERNNAQQGQQSETNDTLDKLGEVIQRQQQLMDRTNRLDRRNNDQSKRRQPGAEKPMTEEELKQALKDLENSQSELKQALKDLKDKMAKQGLTDKKPGAKKPAQKKSDKGKPGPNGEPQQGEQGDPQPGDGEGDDDAFGQAEDSMGDARDSLAEGDSGDAVDAQGQALDKLRQGAKQLMDQLAQQGQPGQRPGGFQNDGQPDDDPLGRPRRNEGPELSNTVKVPDEIDVQRARRILDDIRRRLSEPMRPRLELDYLERLLRGE